MRTIIVTVDSYIEAGLTLRLSAAVTLRLARECGVRIRNDDWYARWREVKAEYLSTGRAA